MENTFKIFVFAHSDFNNKPTNEKYTIVTNPNIEIKNTNLDVIHLPEDYKYLPLQKSMCECCSMKYLSDNVELPNFVSTNHYRAYWPFFNCVPNPLDFLDGNDVVVNPYFVGNVEKWYICNHGYQDWNLIKEIINEYFHSYSNKFNEFCNYNVLYRRNLFFCKSSLYKEMMDFTFSVIDKFIEEIKIKNMDDVNNYIRRNFNKYAIRDFKYQTRLLGFLQERLNAFYIFSNVNKIKFSDIILYENKVIV